MKTNTPKQTVEAKCKCDCHRRHGILRTEHLDIESCCNCENGLRLQTPSPNEAPKGEAAFFYPTKKEVKGLVRFANDLHEKAQPPAPDKEWEDAKALFFEELDYRMGISDDFIKTLDTVLEISFKPLLKAKSQEADRRVEEVIGIVDNYFATKRFASTDIRTNEAVQFQLRVIYNELKKKLSLSHKEKEK